MAFQNKYNTHTHTSLFTLSPYNQTLAYTTKISFFPLQFNKLLEENLSKSPSLSQLLPVIIHSWYHAIPSVPIIRDVKWKSPWCISPLTSRTTFLLKFQGFTDLNIPRVNFKDQHTWGSLETNRLHHCRETLGTYFMGFMFQRPKPITS